MRQSPKKTCSIPGLGETAYGTISSRLPDLVIGKQGVETTSHSSLRYTYLGQLAKWDHFLDDLSKFHNTPKLFEAFQRSENVGIDLAPGWSATPGQLGVGEGESIQTSDEITMSGRFFNNVLNKVGLVIDVLTHPKVHTPEQLATMTNMPKRDIRFGSSKSVPASQRRKYEPDIVVKIPGTGESQAVRLIGELKSPSTYKMQDNEGSMLDFKRDSLKNLFGQVARDMVEFELKYAFVSTYEETVFLKIVPRRSKPGEFALQYSPIIKHTDQVVVSPSGKLISVGVRFALLYFIAEVCDDDTRQWKLSPHAIEMDAWVSPTAKVPKILLQEHATPQRNPMDVTKYPPYPTRQSTKEKTMESLQKKYSTADRLHRKQQTPGSGVNVQLSSKTQTPRRNVMGSDKTLGRNSKRGRTIHRRGLPPPPARFQHVDEDEEWVDEDAIIAD